MYSGVLKVVLKNLQRRQEPWSWGAWWPAIGSWQRVIEPHHRSWSSYNYTRSYQRTQHWPVYFHSAFLKLIGKVKKLNKWMPYELTPPKKKCVLKFYFLLFYMTTNHFSIGLWCATKSVFSVTTSSVVRPRRSSKAFPKPKLNQEKVVVTVWWSATRLIHCNFLNPDKTITSEKYA